MKKNDSNKSEKSFSSSSINWFPGHMAKTRRQIIEDLKLVDVVVEILDARTPIASQNPDLREITEQKKKIIVLNKIDLSNNVQNQKWVESFKEKGVPAILVNSNTGEGIEKFIKEVENIMKEDLKKLAQKGRIGRKIRVMILGIPNVGKSSFINRISKKNSAEVGNKPGVTRKTQWIRINDKIELLDTPGVLWPKFENQDLAMNLAITGTIKDDILDRTEVAYNLVKKMLKEHREKLLERYKLAESEVNNILEQDEPENSNIYEIMLLIGKKRGAIVSGGNVDEEKTSRLILDDFRIGKLGKITLEKV